MAVATRFNDLRRGKWSSFRGQQGETLMAQLQREADERPKPRYDLDEMVLTPLGFKRISDSYHSYSRGWNYAFSTNNGRHSFNEKQLLSQGDGLLLKDVMRIVGAGG